MSSLTVKNTLYHCCPPVLRPYWHRVEASPLGARLARGAFWALTGAVVSRGLMLLASIFVARILGKVAFGEYGMIRSTVTMFGSFAGLSLGLTATKHVAQFRKTDPEQAGRVIALTRFVAVAAAGLMAVVLFFLAPWLATYALGAAHLSGLLRIAGLVLFFNTVCGAQTATLAGFEAFRTIAGVNFLVGALSFPVLLATTYFGGLEGVVWGLVVSAGINLVLNYRALGRKAREANVPLMPKQWLSQWKILWSFSLPAALAGMIAGPANWLCNALLVNQPGGYGEMGIFNAANQWRMAILFVPQVVCLITLPMLANLQEQRQDGLYLKLLRTNTLLAGGIALILAAPIMLFSREIMTSYGKSFSGGALTLTLLALSAVLMSANQVIGQAIVSMGKTWIRLLFHYLWAAVLVVTATVALRAGWSTVGLAVANLTAFGMHCVWQFWYVSTVLSRRRKAMFRDRDPSSAPLVPEVKEHVAY